jgi:hypothetical protein
MPAEQDRDEPGLSDEVFGKLDRLLNRHRTGALPPDPARVPVLTETLAPEPDSGEPQIPTLTDAVAGPGAVGANASTPSQAASGLDTGLAAAILRHLLATLRKERARLASEFGADPEIIRLVEPILDELELALPAAVSAAMNAGIPVGQATSEDDGRI